MKKQSPRMCPPVLENLEERAVPAALNVQSYNWSGYAVQTKAPLVPPPLFMGPGRCQLFKVRPKATPLSGWELMASAPVRWNRSAPRRTSSTARATYYAWYESYPAEAEQPLSLTIKPETR